MVRYEKFIIKVHTLEIFQKLPRIPFLFFQAVLASEQGFFAFRIWADFFANCLYFRIFLAKLDFTPLVHRLFEFIFTYMAQNEFLAAPISIKVIFFINHAKTHPAQELRNYFELVRFD